MASLEVSYYLIVTVLKGGYEPLSSKRCKLACAPIVDSDQSVQSDQSLMGALLKLRCTYMPTKLLEPYAGYQLIYLDEGQYTVLNFDYVIPFITSHSMRMKTILDPGILSSEN